MKRIILALVALSGLLGAVAVFAAEKRACTIADLYRLKGVADPRISPDGKRVLFTVSESDLAKGKSLTQVWVVDAEGGEPRQVTRAESSSRAPRWSPDGRSILFLSGRKEGSQAWVLPVETGEARALTKLSTGVDEAEWGPDGTRVFFSSAVFPECGADDACNRKIQDGLDKGPLQAHLADRLLYRHWTEWADGRRSHLLCVDVQTGVVTDLTPGDFDSPAFSSGGRGYAVSPDGKEICFVSNREADEASTTNKDLWIVPIAGGEPKCLTADNKASDTVPLYSPDGKYLAYLAQAVPTFEADRFRLMVLDRATGERREVTRTWDDWVGEFRWAPDSKSLLFTADVKGRTAFCRVPVEGGEPKPLLKDLHIRAWDLDPTGRWAVLVKDSVGEPADLYRCELADGSLKRLTSLNQAVRDEVDFRPAEEMWVKGASGADVHVFVVKPHGFDPSKKYPLILNVHGGPQMMWADAFRGDWQVYPGAGYVVAFPNPHGSTGYGQAYTDAISKDWNGKVIEDVLKVTDALAAMPYVDSERMGAMGWSWGGYAMMWLEGQSTRFKALAAMMGVYDLRSMHGATEELWFPEYDLGGVPWESPIYRSQNPSERVANYRTPCLVITGERDYRVPYTQSLHFFTDLQKRRVPSRLIVFKNDGHWPDPVKSMPFYYNAHLDWFHTYLGGAPAPYDMKRMWRNQAFETAEGGKDGGNAR